MANFDKHHQKQPVASPGQYMKSDGHVVVNMMPYHHPEPKKPASKCFVYTFAIFVVLCLLLLIFSLVVLRSKPLPLKIISQTLNSLNYDQSPSFSASISAGILIRNPNFGPFRLRSAGISFVHRNSTVGVSDPVGSKKKFVIGERSKDLVKVTVAVKESSESWSDQDRNMMRNELNSGVLQLKGYVRVAGEIVLFNKITRKTSGQLDCDASIDLRSQQLLAFVCS